MRNLRTSGQGFRGSSVALILDAQIGETQLVNYMFKVFRALELIQIVSRLVSVYVLNSYQTLYLIPIFAIYSVTNVHWLKSKWY